MNTIISFFRDYVAWLTIPDFTITDVLEIAIIAFAFYHIILWIKDTRAWVLLKGMVILGIIFLVALVLEMNVVLWVFQNAMVVGIMALVVIFQPELRNALEQLGRKKILSSLTFDNQKSKNERYSAESIEAVIKAVYDMARVKTGALIVVEKEIQCREYERTGIPIGAKISSQLLVNIFEHNTPLHDGAVILRDNRIAAAVILLLIASTISYWWGERQLQNQFADILVEAPLGAKTKLILPDSTLVWLNAGSKIVYSQGFGVKDRHLRLNGEAYFEVRKNEKLPFDVMTKELNVKVLGTKFNFRNYDEDEEVTVNLLEGKVQLENYVKKMGINYLSPSEKVTLNKLTGEMIISRAEVKNAKEWTNDGLFFDEMPLSDIVKELNRSYNVKIHIADEQLTHNRFYALFNRKEQTIYNVLDIITATNQVRYKVEGDSILLYAK